MNITDKVVLFDTYTIMCKKIADEIKEDLQKNPEQLLCIAAGNTSIGVFQELIKMYEGGEIDFSRSYFISMDEWLGMDENSSGSCGNFLVKHFLSHVNYAPDHIMLWNGKTEAAQAECKRVEGFLENGKTGQIDYLVLGCGMNGHLALNEPGIDFNMGAHTSELDEITKRVGQKYFEKKAILEQGITLGIKNFKEAKCSVLMINGEHKQEIASRILQEGKSTNRIPATALYEFENGKIYCDREAVPEK